MKGVSLGLRLMNKFRGSSDLIVSRLELYRPLLEFIKNVHNQSNGTFPLIAVDIGCGRGEMLDLLERSGFKCVGVDKQSYGDNRIVEDDCVDFISCIEDERLTLITSIHLIEHLNFDSFVKLTAESFRALKSDGVMIIESPNPQSLLSMFENFYNDPSHVKPFPFDLVRETMEFYGFDVVVICPRYRIDKNRDDRYGILERVFMGPCSDYAVIAVKPGRRSSEIISFARETYAEPVRLRDSIRKSDRLLEDYCQMVNTVNSSIEKVLNQLDSISASIGFASVLHSRITALEYERSELEELLKKKEVAIGLLEERIKSLESTVSFLKNENAKLQNNLEAVYKSKSWKVTAPLRFIYGLLLKPCALRKVKDNQASDNCQNHNTCSNSTRFQNPNRARAAEISSLMKTYADLRLRELIWRQG
ncbi:MAG: class I SAM-dependent methyltransferase [Thermoproteota archaeon]